MSVPPFAKVIALERCMGECLFGRLVEGSGCGGEAAGVECFARKLFQVGGGAPFVDFEMFEGVDRTFFDAAGDGVVSVGLASVVVVEDNTRWG